MFNYLKYRFKLKKLSNSNRKTQDCFSKKISEAHKQKKPKNEIASLRDDAFFEYKMIQEEIDILITNYLRKKAHNLFVPLPTLPDIDNHKMWIKCNTISNQNVLTTLGIHTTKNAIRKEKKEKNEIVFMWAMFLIGLIGAVTGLIAVIKMALTQKSGHSNFFKVNSGTQRRKIRPQNFKKVKIKCVRKCFIEVSAIQHTTTFSPPIHKTSLQITPVISTKTALFHQYMKFQYNYIK